MGVSDILEKVVVEDQEAMLTAPQLINLVTLLLGMYISYTSIKLLVPLHPLYQSYAEGFSHLAQFWGIAGRGRLFRIAVGLGKLFCGLSAAIFCWSETTVGALGTILGLVGIAAIMAGAVLTNFPKGWSSTQIPAALFATAIVCLYLQSEFGVLQDFGGLTLLASITASSLVGYFSYLRGMAVQAAIDQGTTKVAVLARGESARPDTYYRLA